jgi:parallel beta-helix repeat protein
LDLPYYYARNIKQILTFDALGDPGVTYTGGAYNFTYYKIGDASRGFTNSAGPQTIEASWVTGFDLNVFTDGSVNSTDDFICFIVYLGGTLPGSLKIGFSTSQANYAAKNFEKTISSGLSTGYLFIHIAKSAFTKTGTGFDWNFLTYLKLQYTGGDTTTDVYFDNLQLIRKDPSGATPNPFQKEDSTTWSVTQVINSGEWFVGKENGFLVYKNLNPQNDVKALLGNLQFNEFHLTCELTCLTDNYLYGPAWYIDDNNYLQVFIDNNQLTLAYKVTGVSNSVSTAMTVVKNDIIAFKISKSGSSALVTVAKTNDIHNPYFLTATIALGSGYIGLCSKADKYSRIQSFSVTKLPYASFAEDGGNDYWKGQGANRDYNVRFFGAKGDGTTDDTIAIQNAIHYLNGSSGGTLIFPKGTYKVTSQLTLCGDLMIDGCNSTLYADPAPSITSIFYTPENWGVTKSLTADGIQGNFTVSVTDTAGLAVGDYVIISEGSIFGLHANEFLCIESLTANSVTFNSALTYHYSAASNASIYQMIPLQNLTIRDLIIEYAPTPDITYAGIFQNIINTKLTNIQISNIYKRGFLIKCSVNVEVESCYLTKGSDPSLYEGFNIDACSNLIMKDNKLFGFTYGTLIYRVEQAIISRNHLKGSSTGQSGIYLGYCLHSIVESNLISGGYYHPLYINNSGRCLIKKNSLVGARGTAIEFDSEHVNNPYDCGHIIEGNNIESCGYSGHGISLDWGMSKSIIKDNLIKDVPLNGIYSAENCIITGNTIINPGN